MKRPFRVLFPAMVLDFDDIALRLGAAAVMGILIGINRDLQNKPIGARTLGLVGLGTATVAVAGIQFPGMAENPDAASRVIQGIIQGVMTGISFIGAGVILRDAKARSVEGLTTAATVWVTAALGVACGLGEWRSVAIAVPVALALLVIVPWVENAMSKARKPE
jgi:putative Mg2+ transporter-C (MgtC) family protein